MEQKKNLRSAILDGSLIIALAFSMAACNSSQKPDDSKDMAEEMNEEKMETNKAENDAEFLVDAAEVNLMEIQLGNLAAERGMTNEVKEMGKMMVSAHTKSFDELKGLAGKKAITIPTSLTAEGQKAYEKLMEKSGKDFDKEYCDMMVSGHKDAVDRFEKASDKSNDMEIKEWATATLPTLRTHLEHAKMCEENIKKM